MATLRNLIRIVRPFWLREKLFWRLRALQGNVTPDEFANITLEYEPAVSLALKPTDVGHQQIAYLGYMERPLTEMMKAMAIRGGFLVDVGANYGYFTCLWAAANPTNRVVAFEASPRNVAALRANVERNNLQESVVIVPNAAGRSAGRMRFSLGPETETGWGGLAVDEQINQVEVDVVSLSEFLNAQDPTSRVDVLKIDTEGADTWVLNGCESLLRTKRVQNIFFENNPTRMAALGIDPDDAVALLKRYGYTLNRIGDEGWHAFA
jgi:FkbM family methyltransferase